VNRKRMLGQIVNHVRHLRVEQTTTVVGTRRYDIRPDGRVNIFRHAGAGVWEFVLTVERDFYGLPSCVRFPCSLLDKENAEARRAS
jgi:hypothetical protein